MEKYEAQRGTQGTGSPQALLQAVVPFEPLRHSYQDYTAETDPIRKSKKNIWKRRTLSIFDIIEEDSVR